MTRSRPAPPNLQRSTALWLGLIALLAFVWRLAAGSHPIDDAYITFRYAANLLQGSGLVFQAGEPVLGTTSPLTAVMLAVAAAPFGPSGLPTASLILNALSDAFSVLLLAWMMRRLQMPPWTIVAGCLLFALAPLGVRYAIGGMETSLATLCLLGAACLFLDGREAAGAHVAGLGFLVRPDIVAITAAFAWGAGLVEHRLARRALGITGLWVVGAVIVFLVAYQTPLPHSVLAKVSPVYRAGPFSNATQILYFFGGAVLASPWGMGARGLVVSPGPPSVTLAMTIFFLLQALAWAVGLRTLVRRLPLSIFLGLFPLIVTAVYLISGLRGSLMAEWYLPPLFPFWIVPILAGLDRLLSRLPGSLYLGTASGLAALLVSIEVAGFRLGLGEVADLTVPRATWEEREVLYQKAALEIRRIASEDAVVAAPEIGALGYFCQCRILDTVGLVSPRALSYYPLPPGSYSANNAVPAELIRQEKPDYLVSLEVFVRDTLLSDERFGQDYRIVWQAPTDAFGSRGLLLFQRVAGDE